jgi:hypothetical protein
MGLSQSRGTVVHNHLDTETFGEWSKNDVINSA